MAASKMESSCFGVVLVDATACGAAADLVVSAWTAAVGVSVATGVAVTGTWAPPGTESAVGVSLISGVEVAAGAGVSSCAWGVEVSVLDGAAGEAVATGAIWVEVVSIVFWGESTAGVLATGAWVGSVFRTGAVVGLDGWGGACGSWVAAAAGTWVGFVFWTGAVVGLEG